MWNEPLRDKCIEACTDLYLFHRNHYGYAPVIWLANWKAVYGEIYLGGITAAKNYRAQVQASYLWPSQLDAQKKLNNRFDKLIELISAT